MNSCDGGHSDSISPPVSKPRNITLPGRAPQKAHVYAIHISSTTLSYQIQDGLGGVCGVCEGGGSGVVCGDKCVGAVGGCVGMCVW